MAGGASTYQDEGGDSPIVDINVTPLVDIVLVLLIIFMVTASLIVNPGIKAELPKAASGEEIRTTLALTITKDGQLHVNGEPRTEEEAKVIIRAAVRGNPDRPEEALSLCLPHPARLCYLPSHESAPSGRSQRACASAARKAISYQSPEQAGGPGWIRSIGSCWRNTTRLWRSEPRAPEA